MRTRQAALLFLLALGSTGLGAFVLYLKWRDGSHPDADLVLGGLTGMLFLAAGVVAHARRPDARVGLLMVLVGVSLFAEDLQFSWQPWIFVLGRLLSHSSAATSAHLVLAFPTGKLGSARQRVLVGSAYATAIVWPAVGVLFYYPPSVGQHKPENPLLLWDDAAIVGLVNTSMQLGGTVIAAAVLVVLLRRWLRASWPMRLVLAPVCLTGLFGALVTAASGILGYDSASGRVGLLLYKMAFCLLPLGFLAGLLRVRAGATRVESLLIELGVRHHGSLDRLRSILSRSLRDPTLRLELWNEDRSSYVDDSGEDYAVPTESPSRAVTFIAYEGRPLAALVHDPALREDRVRLDAVVAGTSIVLERQRLAGAMLTQVHRSRAKVAEAIVEATDEQRRRLGQDLHDGAQQNLMVALAHLRSAIERLDSVPDGTALTALASCDEALGRVRAELSDIASGLYPPALTYFGIGAAVAALARDMPIDINIDIDIDAVGERLPRLEPAIEYTAYMVVKEAFANILKHARAGNASVHMRHTEGALHVTVSDDGVGGASLSAGTGLLGLQGRVEAVGGALTVANPAGRGAVLHVVLPCAPSRLATTSGQGVQRPWTASVS